MRVHISRIEQGDVFTPEATGVQLWALASVIRCACAGNDADGYCVFARRLDNGEAGIWHFSLESDYAERS